MVQVRIRRGRVFAAAAAISITLLYFLGKSREWDFRADERLAQLQEYGNSWRHGVGDPSLLDWRPHAGKEEGHAEVSPHGHGLGTIYDDLEEYLNAGMVPEDDGVRDPMLLPPPPPPPGHRPPPPPGHRPPPPPGPPPHHDASSSTSPNEPEQAHAPFPPQPKVTGDAPIFQEGNGRLKAITSTNTVSATHWRSMKEHFPVPTESLIRLPTGTPKKIPKIQHTFGTESPQDKADRQLKLAEIKAAMDRTWSAYRRHAWAHDELMPLQAAQSTPDSPRDGFRDPFAGWGATLVDSLDTLWIMGMKEEFEEAVNATMEIDFTTTLRSEIPVFETTIRYLGGLLGAYDISGQQEKYHGLVDKAVELAEVLMGAFDTPTRAPVVYYQWQPQLAMLPKRGQDHVAMAEVGSLSLEFTRLAQLTGEHKYYDAVARVTEYFRKWQDETLIPGLFDLYVDATGCANSLTLKQMGISQKEEEEEMRKDFSSFGNDSEDNIVIHVDAEGDGDAPNQQKDHSSFGEADSEIDVSGHDSKGNAASRQAKRQEKGTSGTGSDTIIVSSGPVLAPGITKPAATHASTGPTCVEYNGFQSYTGNRQLDSPPPAEFGLGGMADSTYEYFPKQYILLGGLQDDYRKMYEKALAASKKYLFFQPMINDSIEITSVGTYYATGTISGDGTGAGHADGHLSTKTDHLSCFVGGMVALGARIFGQEEDMQLAERIANSCIWAYSTTSAGIMPEDFELLPCPEEGSCAWNQTYWYQQLDPDWDKRDDAIEKWEIAEKVRKAKEAEEELDRLRTEAEKASTEVKTEDGLILREDKSTQNEAEGGVVNRQGVKDALADLAIPDVVPNGIGPSAQTQHTKDTPAATAPASQQATNARFRASWHPPRPPTHEEFVEQKIKNERLYPGVLGFNRREYILRPEALESVFYLYRTTGSPLWREKGWQMFESIENYTRTELAYSSVYDVTSKEPVHNGVMESFWVAETLKYVWLLFSSEDVVSLDEWVLNTEAHPFRRGDAGRG